MTVARLERPSFVVRSGAAAVEAWAVRRLSFEPKGWQLEFRSELRAAIAGLSGDDDAVLAAAYTSADRMRCDIENVLFYNVGLTAFSALRAQRVVFERSFLSPLPSPVPLSEAARHHQRYEVTDPSGPAFWSVGGHLASFSARAWLPLDATRVWSALRFGELQRRTDRSFQNLCLRLRVGMPALSSVSIFSLLKPVLDGVIAACHVHDGTALADVAGRLAGTLGTTPDEIAAQLMDDRFNVLGERALVRLHRDGVMWNPADDDLVAVDIQVEPATDPTITGDLYEATPLHA